MSDTSYCSLCNVTLKSSAVSFSHYNGQMHKKKLESPVAQVHRCDVCNVTCTGEIPFQAHMRSKKHLHKVSMGSESEEIAERTDDQNDDQEIPLDCDICSKKFKKQNAAKVHFFSDAHKKKLKILEEINSGIDLHLICNICIVKCTNENQMDAHMNSGHHLKKIDGTAKKSPPVKKIKQEGNDENDGQIQNSTLSTEQYCEICDMKLLTLQQFEAHINGQKHKKKLENPVAASVVLNCDLCNVSCTGNIPFQSHLKSVRHMKRLSKVVEQKEAPADLSNDGQPSGLSDSDADLLNHSFISTIEVLPEYQVIPGFQNVDVDVSQDQENVSDENDPQSNPICNTAAGSEIGDSAVEENIAGSVVGEVEGKSGTLKNASPPEPPRRQAAAEESKNKIQRDKSKKMEKIEAAKPASFKNSFVPETSQPQQEVPVATQPPKNDNYISDKKDNLKRAAIEENKNVAEESESSKKSKRAKRASLSCEHCPVKGLDEKEMAAHLLEHKKQLPDKKSQVKEVAPTRSLRKRRSDSGGAATDDAKVMKGHERDS